MIYTKSLRKQKETQRDERKHKGEWEGEKKGLS